MNVPNLLPIDRLVRTSSIDHADWNYKGLLGYIQRRRFALVADLLGDARYHRLFELGYGSGVFMPELAKRCDVLLGGDIHFFGGDVTRALNAAGIGPRLTTSSAAALPLPDESVDCVVAVSTLEFIDDLEKAMQEINRVLTPEGHLIAVTPGHSPVLDWGLKLLTGESAKADFEKRRERIVPTLLGAFDRIEGRRYPPFRPLPHNLYRAFKLGRKSSS